MFNGTAWTKEAGALNESMTYDRNGNILSLQRSHRKHELNGLIASYVPETMDQLTYTYTTELKDRLLKVTDGASNPVDGFSNGTSGTANDYTYDGQGNITADNNKGIDSLHYNYLGKVRRIKFSDGRVITYTYDAAGSKLTMKVCESSACTTTDYVGGFVYQDNVLSFFASPGGRVVNKNNNLEYQYSIADHQGNTRIVFSSVLPQTQDGVTDFESDNGTLENFPSGGTHSSTPLFPRSGTMTNLLNGGYNSQVGVAKAYKVYPGDKVSIKAFAKYEGGGSSTGTGFASALLAAFSLSAPAAGELGTPSAGLDAWGGFVDGGVQDDNGTAPQAFVNIIVYDKDFNFLDAAWDQISENAEQVGTSPVVPHDELFKEYTISEAGYVFLYISNNSPVNVYFDDILIEHTPTNVVQYNEYYPFGLQTANSWTREEYKNDFLYNGGTELNSTTGYYDLFYRNYDATIGRFMQVDPLSANQMATYQYSGNNPVMFNDPLGDKYDWKRIQWESSASSVFVGHDPFPNDGGGGGGGYEAYGVQTRIGRGSGNHWADGIGYSDWTPNGGSDAYRAGLAAGLHDIGGELYSFGPDGTLYQAEYSEGKMWYTDVYSENGEIVVHARGISVDGYNQAQQGVIITVTDNIVGNTEVKGYPDNVLDENGKQVTYTVPLYEVRVSGYDEGNFVSQTFKAIRFGVYHDKKTGSGPYITEDYNGVYSGRWEKHPRLGDVIRVIGAGRGGVLFHLGPANNYVPGAIGCVEIFGPGQFQFFQNFINNSGGAGTNIMIRFEPAARPPLTSFKSRP